MQPTLWINPHGDRVFAEVVESIARQEGTTVEAVERALRARYPNARVHARNLSGEQDVTWYVYREGRWVSAEQ